MPTVWQDPEVAFWLADDTPVYHVYANGNADEPRAFWFTLNPENSDEDGGCENGVFDVRTLPESEALTHSPDLLERIIRSTQRAYDAKVVFGACACGCDEEGK